MKDYLLIKKSDVEFIRSDLEFSSAGVVKSYTDLLLLISKAKEVEEELKPLSVRDIEKILFDVRFDILKGMLTTGNLKNGLECDIRQAEKLHKEIYGVKEDCDEES